MAKGYKIRLDISRERAVFVRMDYGARGRLYRSAKVEVDRKDLESTLTSTKVLDGLAEEAGAS